MYNLSTSRETQITTNRSDQMRPSIYGDRIVWTDERNIESDGYFSNGNWDTYMYNLSTSRETQITTNESCQTYPAIYGDRIVWQDGKYGGSIYMYDLSTSKEIGIATNESFHYFPVIDGDRIIWQGHHNGKNHIYMYNFSTSTETQINDIDLAGWRTGWIHDIYGDNIVWEYWDGTEFVPNSDIYMYNLSTSKKTRLTTYNSDQRSPAIYEDKIVWEDHSNGNSDIHMYDLSTSRKIRIATSESMQLQPDIYENRIVWVGMHNGNRDIYMCIVSGEKPESKTPVENFSTNENKKNAGVEEIDED